MSSRRLLSHPARPRWPLLSASLATCLLWASASAAAERSPLMLTVGAGVQRQGTWLGAKGLRSEALPYIDVEWANHVSLSTVDGLQVDFIHGHVLHGGIYGDYQWGRTREELGALGGIVTALPPRFNLGGYLEWQLTDQFDLGANLSHDINGAGAYLSVYAEWDLPSMGVVEHSIQLRWQALNASAMNRNFGLNPSQASVLNTDVWEPGAGSELATLEYDVFVPTSQHTGVALGLVYGRLLGNAGNSPLVTRFGSRRQLSESLAFVYHL